MTFRTNFTVKLRRPLFELITLLCILVNGWTLLGKE